MNHAETLRYLASIEGLGIKLALQNITSVLAALGDPQDRFPSVLVSGTNGKGSVAAMLASILRRTGRRTGLYTSPHLIRHEERIVVDGRPVSPPAFAAAITRVHNAVQDLLEMGRLEAHPTHFETLTAAAFDHFAESRVDIAVLEVGMGGRLDATVLAKPKLAVITNVDLEHTAFLGGSIGAIASEKAGVLMEGGVLLTGETHPAAVAAFEKRARETRGRLVPLSDYARIEATAGPTPEGIAGETQPRGAGSRGSGGAAGDSRATLRRFGVRTPRRSHQAIECGLYGGHQIGNALLAVAACDLLDELGYPVSVEAIREGVRSTVWPGRFQIVDLKPPIILDGAHNPAACRVLRTALAEWSAGDPKRVTLLFGALRDKDHEEMMAALFPASARVVLTRGASPRFQEPHALAADLSRNSIPAAPDRSPSLPEIRITETLEEGLAEARDITPEGGCIVICGSLYLVGDAMQALGIDPWTDSSL